jgi:outer membrane immunogenic protein
MLRKTLAVAAVSLAFSVCSGGVSIAQDIFGSGASNSGRISWTGVTVGAHGGFLWGDTDWDGAPEYIAPPLPAAGSGPPNPDLEGGFLGAQIGYSQQLGNLVVGVEADISFSEIDDTKRDGNFITETTELEKFGTVRGKLGYAYGAWQPYVTGGFAWADVSFSQQCPFNAANGHCSRAGLYTRSDDASMNGWTIGGGLKYAASNNIIIGAEYLYIDFGDAKFDLGPPQNREPITAKWPLELKTDVVKLTVDYKF